MEGKGGREAATEDRALTALESGTAAKRVDVAGRQAKTRRARQAGGTGPRHFYPGLPRH